MFFSFLLNNKHRKGTSTDTNSKLQPNGVNLLSFKLRPFDPTEF